MALARKPWVSQMLRLCLRLSFTSGDPVPSLLPFLCNDNLLAVSQLSRVVSVTPSLSFLLSLFLCLSLSFSHFLQPPRRGGGIFTQETPQHSQPCSHLGDVSLDL